MRVNVGCGVGQYDDDCGAEGVVYLFPSGAPLHAYYSTWYAHDLKRFARLIAVTESDFGWWNLYDIVSFPFDDNWFTCDRSNESTAGEVANGIADICSSSGSPTTTTPEPTTTIAAAGASQCPVDFCKVYFDGCNTCTCNTKGVLTRCSQKNTCAGSAKAAKCRKFHPTATTVETTTKA